MGLFLRTLWLCYTPVNIYIHLTADTNNIAYVVQYKYFSVIYFPIKYHNCLLFSLSDRTLAAS